MRGQARFTCPSGAGRRIQAQDTAQSWIGSLLIAYRDCHGHAGTGNSSLTSLCCAGTSFTPLPKPAVPEYAGLARRSIQAAPETWPCTCPPNPTRHFLPRRRELRVCSAAGTEGPSQPRPQQRGTSHSRATGTHPNLGTHQQRRPWPQPLATATLQSLPNHIFTALVLHEAGLQQPAPRSQGFWQRLPLGQRQAQGAASSEGCHGAGEQ